MKTFLSCDWGTTSFRIRLVYTSNGEVFAEEISNQGIAGSFELWERSGRPGEDKVSFYLAIIQQHMERMEAKLNQSLNGVKLIISGMASSSIGFIDLPYSALPLQVDGSGFNTGFIPATKTFDHDVLIISGLKTRDDVMRGEETQLIGCIDATQTIKNELYIFPGTHSKHISVKDNQITGFKTYMTGEFFELLSQKSILKNGVEKGGEPAGENGFDSFKRGVREAMSGNLLHSAFKVRTNHLFDNYSKTENFNFLSGLLVGAELNDLKTTGADAINLICGSNLEGFYYMALQEIGITKIIHRFPPKWVDEAVVRGQLQIARQLKILA